MDTIGIIPAAGRGVRLGASVPKPLLRVGHQALIEYAIDNIAFAGVHDIVLVVPPGYESTFFNLVNSRYDTERFNFFVTTQPEPKGIAEAVSLGFDLMPGAEAALVHLGDEFNIEPGLGNIGSDLLKELMDKDAHVVEAYHVEDDPDIIKQTNELWVEDNGKILEIIEKPEMPSSNMRGIGIYAFRRDAFDLLYSTAMPSKGRGEYEITDIVRRCAGYGKAYAVYFDGVCININTNKDLNFAEEVAGNADQK